MIPYRVTVANNSFSVFITTCLIQYRQIEREVPYYYIWQILQIKINCLHFHAKSVYWFGSNRKVMPNFFDKLEFAIVNLAHNVWA